MKNKIKGIVSLVKDKAPVYAGMLKNNIVRFSAGITGASALGFGMGYGMSALCL